ncbi:His-Xaa-Ser system protein HxsD [Chitinophaga sp. YR627]|uniref:His-Xaa-Ser system protein HxsD n=1 Tax=Chitinophaga sp. YR627 TaxID=1881041 RepID=UPI0008E91F2A|nr:His-Xaa-Ser system protein HxsD [Chitinophaga sp. YR627]SFO54897.1 His-Xaa-Ser system protein HxsD [Chitinophaga sp. YR627]
MDVQVTNNVLTVTVDESIYPEKVLLKCLYWYSDTWQLEIDRVHQGRLQITIHAKDDAIVAWEPVSARLKRDLIDFKLRQIVADETRTIRELIVAKAFAYYEPEETPLSIVSDPVGFDPTSV